MAWVNTYEKWSQVNGEVEQLPGPNMFRGFASRGYSVLFNAAATSMEAANASGLPALGEQFPTYTYCKCQRRRAVPLGPLLWEVICEYAGPNSALNAAYERRWGWLKSVEAVEVDANGVIIANPLGQRYYGLTMEWEDPVYLLTRNQAAFDQATLETYHRSVNSDTVLGWTAGKAHLIDISAQQIYEGSDYYWRVTYQIAFRRDGWKRKLRCEGTHYWNGSGNVKDRTQWIKFDPSVAGPSGRGRLKADGTACAAGDADVIQQFDLYKAVAYAGLSLT